MSKKIFNKRQIKGLIGKITSANRTLTMVLFIALGSVILMDAVLKKIPAPFEAFVIGGNLYYNVCLAYITSYVFYFVTDYLPNYKKKVNTFRYVNNKIGCIYEDKQDFLNQIINGSQLRTNNLTEGLNNIKQDDVRSACKNINPLSPVLLISTKGLMRFSNWYQYFDYLNRLFKDNINDLLQVQDCLDEKILKRLTNIEDYFSQHINATKGKPLGNTDLEFFQKVIFKLHCECEMMIDDFTEANSAIEIQYHYEAVKENIKKR